VIFSGALLRMRGVERRLRSWAWQPPACSAAAVGLNHGLSPLLYPFKTVSIGCLRYYIQERQSPSFHRLEVQPFLWMLLLGTLAFALSSKPKRPSELIGFLGFGAMALLAGRNIALFAIVAAPPLARHAGSALEPLTRRIRRGRQVPPRVAGILNASILAGAGGGRVEDHDSCATR
jgi:hypothetical protein